MIGILESDKSSLFELYKCMSELKLNFRNLSLSREKKRLLNEIVDKRWAFIHTESMGFAYMLTPASNKPGSWDGNDKLDTKIQLKEYAALIYQEDQLKDCQEEIEQYLSCWANMSPSTLEEFFGMSGRMYWSQFGADAYPLLQSIAMRMFNIPTSSASAERVWSIFSFIHSKSRNRLNWDKASKLAFIYINSSFLDLRDEKNYLEEEYDEEWEEI